MAKRLRAAGKVVMKRDMIIGALAVVAIIAAGVAAWEWRGETPAPSSAPPGAAAPPNADATPVPSPDTPSFDVVRVAPDGSAVIAGRAAPGAEVTILDGTQEIGRVTADRNGEWVLTPKEKLAPGPHQLSLAARSPGDGSLNRSEGVVAMMVPERAQPQGPVAVLVPSEGPARALQLPADRRKFALDIIQYDGSGKVQMLGRAMPGTAIDIYLDDRAAAHGRADESGTWSVTLADKVPVGRYRLRLEGRPPSGEASRLALTFNRVAPPEGALAVDVQPGNNLWRIAQHSYGEGLRYTEIYRANEGQIHDPNLIYPGQVFAVPDNGAKRE
jgi:nucleoid-associated protein YgaU